MIMNVLNVEGVLCIKIDSQLRKTHCDDCGEVFSNEEYIKIVKRINNV